MRIDRQIFLAFLVILAIVMVGFVANLRFLFKMVEAQEKVDEEWAELNAMVDVQKIVARISEEVDQFGTKNVRSRDLIWDIGLGQDVLLVRGVKPGWRTAREIYVSSMWKITPRNYNLQLEDS